MSIDVAAVLERIVSGEKPSDLESEVLEFKQSASSRNKMMKILNRGAICFANASGGTIIVGVADNAVGPEAIVGTELDALGVKQRIYEASKPPLLVPVLEHWHENKRLIVIDVPAGLEEPYNDSQGGAWHRVGRSCLPMMPREQAALIEERRRLGDWSAELSQSSVDDIDPQSLDTARERLNRDDDELRPLADLEDIELLRALGVVNGQDQLLRAGEALFCDRGDAQPWVIYQYRNSPGGEATAVERLSGPLVTLFKQLVDLVWVRRNTTPIILADGSQIELADFPRAAVREVVANALLHRDMRSDLRVSVEHSPSEFVVESPGHLLTGITNYNILTHPPKHRNPCLFYAARKLRIVEDTGRGIDRIYRELIRSGHDLPSITQTTDTTRVVFFGGAPRTQLARFVAHLKPSEREDVNALLLIFTLLTSQTITEAKLAPIIQKMPEEAGGVLKRLANDKVGIIEPTRGTRTRRKPTYRLRPQTIKALDNDITYPKWRIGGNGQSLRASNVNPKVIAHIQEYGLITNRTLQNLFNIDLHRASALLRELQKDGILVKTSKHQRGPGVEYGLGSNFPK